MPMIEGAAITAAFDDVTLAENEFWQCRAGEVLVTAEADPGADDGVRLDRLLGLDFNAGDVVSFRSIGGSAARIWREPRS